MKPRSLLEDVFTDAAAPDWRDTVLEQTLRHVRHRRRLRRCGQGLVASALLIAGVFGLWRALRPATIGVTTHRGGLQFVHSRPLPPGMLVQTRSDAVRVVTTAPDAVAFVQSTRGSLREINDAELLAMLRGHPAVLIKHGPNDAELILLNPEDRNGFVVR